MVPLDSVDSLNQLQPDFEALWALYDEFQTTGFHPIASQSSDCGNRFSARQFPNNAGYNEDPATGVAACALAVYLTRFLLKTDGWHSYEIQQDRAMGRPSRLAASARIQSGQITYTRVSGAAQILSLESKTIAG
jgi:PhzF family phenazine biosynthesis protein